MEAILERQAEAYLHPGARPGFGLQFPAELEARYELERLELRSRQVWLTGILAVFFYDLFLFADYSKHPSVIWRCVLLRLGVVTPIILVTEWFVRNRTRAAIREGLVLCSITVANGAVLAISYNLNRADSMFSQTGFMLIIFFGSLILRQEFAYCVVATVVMLLEDAIFLTTDRWMTADDKVTSIFMVVTSLVLSVIANYMMEKQERTSFALFMKEEFHSKTLSRLNQKLTALSQVDGLTGLSNRRHFEQRFQDLWQEAMGTAQPLSLLMIDIDHFKRLNDTYGHIAGDRVLIQMGQILTSAVPSPDFPVARFGGEEFIVLLVNTPHDRAHQIAEDLRRLVCESPLQPGERDSRGSVTVSCGLGTVFPLGSGDGDQDRLRLVAEADLALYAAKSAGRNRVCCRACEAKTVERRRLAGGNTNVPASSVDLHIS